MTSPPDFEILVGTYEEYLLGYKVNQNNEKLELKQSFATHEHSSSLRTVTTCGKYVASGGADDRICVYDMVVRKEHVMLTNHNSTVNCLEFTTGNTHLVSSSTDGHLIITRVGNWVVEKLWEKAHKNGYVIAMAIHPTGKLALTLGSDSTLQTWNLIKGRKAYIINLNSKSTDARSLSFIKWGPCGEKFILGGGENIEIWNISSGGILNKYNYKSKVICATWINENLIVIGHENGKLTLINIDSNETEEYIAFTNRVKCLEYKNNYLVTSSSSGIIKLWSVHDETLTELCQVSTGCRVTCLALVDGIKIKKQEKNEPTEIHVPENKSKPINFKQRIIIEEGSDEEQLQQNGSTKKKKNKKRKQENKNELNDKKKKKSNETSNTNNKEAIVDNCELITPNKKQNLNSEEIVDNNLLSSNKKKNKKPKFEDTKLKIADDSILTSSSKNKKTVSINTIEETADMLSPIKKKNKKQRLEFDDTDVQANDSVSSKKSKRKSGIFNDSDIATPSKKQDSFEQIADGNILSSNKKKNKKSDNMLDISISKTKDKQKLNETIEKTNDSILCSNKKKNKKQTTEEMDDSLIFVTPNKTKDKKLVTEETVEQRIDSICSEKKKNKIRKTAEHIEDTQLTDNILSSNKKKNKKQSENILEESLNRPNKTKDIKQNLAIEETGQVDDVLLSSTKKKDRKRKSIIIETNESQNEETTPNKTKKKNNKLNISTENWDVENM